MNTGDSRPLRGDCHLSSFRRDSLIPNAWLRRCSIRYTDEGALGPQRVTLCSSSLNEPHQEVGDQPAQPARGVPPGFDRGRSCSDALARRMTLQLAVAHAISPAQEGRASHVCRNNGIDCGSKRKAEGNYVRIRAGADSHLVCDTAMRNSTVALPLSRIHCGWPATCTVACMRILSTCGIAIALGTHRQITGALAERRVATWHDPGRAAETW